MGAMSRIAGMRSRESDQRSELPPVFAPASLGAGLIDRAADFHERRDSGGPVTYDYGTARGWGWDYTFSPQDGGRVGRLSGFAPYPPKVGDYLILQNGEGTTRYRVTSVDPSYSEPHDMYFADVEFAPRPAGEA
jgi:hypothetical protein